jgi:hypothetical protein
MSEYDDRLKNLREHIKDAKDELLALPKEEREASQASLDRLLGVIAYSAVVLERTDAELISAQAFAEVQQAASQIPNNPSVALANADGYGDALLNSVTRLPVTVGREVEQSVKDAAANFQRSASQRLNALSQDLRGAQNHWPSGLGYALLHCGSVDGRRISRIDGIESTSGTETTCSAAPIMSTFSTPIQAATGPTIA